MERAPKMVVEFRYGQMARGTMGSGAMAWRTDMEDSSTLRAMFTKVSGPKIKPMGMACTHTSMVADTKDNGLPTNSTDLELSSGPMVPSTMANTNKE